jgi:hypothetical protein
MRLWAASLEPSDAPKIRPALGNVVYVPDPMQVPAFSFARWLPLSMASSGHQEGSR